MINHLLRRIGAYLLDILLCYGVIFVPLQLLIYTPINHLLDNRLATNPGWLAMYVILTISLPVWFYFIGCEWSAWRATVGKRLLGLQVTSASPNHQLHTAQIILRNGAKLLPWEIAHLAVNLPLNLVLFPEQVIAPWRVGLIGLAYLLIFAYLITAVRTPSQTVYDRLLETAAIIHK
ncbi:MAG: RDD family protein [Chloroflexota bacterium]